MNKLQVSIVMSSSDDWVIMQEAERQLQDFGVAYDARVISAHQSPDLLFDYIKDMTAQGVQCFIAGAGGAAHLAGMVASKTALPVLGVPIPSKYLKGMDTLLSIVQIVLIRFAPKTTQPPAFQTPCHGVRKLYISTCYKTV